MLLNVDVINADTIEAMALAIVKTRSLKSALPPHPAYDSLLEFTQHTFPAYRAEPVHRLIAATLDRAVSGELKRLMIFAPPQHGKSELVSVRLPPYWLGHHPNSPVILTSYGASLAENKSRQARRVVESEEFKVLFGKTTSQESRAVSHWELEGHRGGLLAAGVGGPIIGHGAMLGLIDDPVENWEQAQSVTYRERTWEWWRSTFRPRIWEDGIIVLIMSRWHEDDLAGRILKEQRDDWEVLRLPALAESQEARDFCNARLGLALGLSDPLGRQEGEALAPLRFSRNTLLQIQRDVGSVVWGAEYQGFPTAAAGNRFKRAWFQISEVPGWPVEVVRYWDKAGTASSGAWTCGVLMARYPSGNCRVEDVVRGQWSSLEREIVIKQTAIMDAARYRRLAIWVEQEPGSGGKESAESTVLNLAGYNIRADRPTGAKEVRAEPFAAQCEAGNVWLAGGAWNQSYIDELISFPHSVYKDQVDASSGAFNKLTHVTVRGDGHDPVVPKPNNYPILAARQDRRSILVGRGR